MKKLPAMNKLLRYFLIIFFTIPLACCKKNIQGNTPKNQRLQRVEYYDPTGTSAGFRKLTYSADVITRIDLISGNWQNLEYENNKVTGFSNMLLGVPFPITSFHLKYSA